MNRRMLVDTSMLFVFLLLLNYRYVHNFGHEMLALVFTALFLLHTIWNARWYHALFRGRWPKQRIVVTGIDLLLLFLFLGVMLTGLSFSHTMPIFNIHPPLWVHRLHRIFGFLMLFAMGLHLGIHWQGIWDLGKDETGDAHPQYRTSLFFEPRRSAYPCSSGCVQLLPVCTGQPPLAPSCALAGASACDALSLPCLPSLDRDPLYGHRVLRMEMGEQKVESPAIITDQKTHEPFPAREFFAPPHS